MPISNKKQIYRIHIVAIVIALLLIAGSIYLHLKQKHRLGRLKFDRDPVYDLDVHKIPLDTDSDALIVQSTQAPAVTKPDEKFISPECMHCICMAVKGCKVAPCRPGVDCGLYRISKFYWIDGGRLTVAGDKVYKNEDEGYLECANNQTCAEKVVRNYNKKYLRDCNMDGVIDCEDHIYLHLMGPTGCRQQPLAIHAQIISNCLSIK